MKLYVAPGGCSLAAHIAFEEAKVPVEVVVCPWDEPARWTDVERLNPLGAIPVLALDDGGVLTQCIAILVYLAERAPEAGLLPAPGTRERAEVLRWLSFAATDLHKSFTPFFDPTATDEVKRWARAKIESILPVIERHLAGRAFVAGETFTIADAYLFAVSGWLKPIDLSIAAYPILEAYAARIGARPAVRAAMAREGLAA